MGRFSARWRLFLFALAGSVLMLGLTAPWQGSVQAMPVIGPDGTPLMVDDVAGSPPRSVYGMVEEAPVLVAKLDRAAWEGRGAQAVPGEAGSVLVAYSAKSTHLGCRVDLLQTGGDVLGGARDVLLVDLCHPQFAWDPYDAGRTALGVFHPPPDCAGRPPEIEEACRRQGDVPRLPGFEVQVREDGSIWTKL